VFVCQILDNGHIGVFQTNQAIGDEAADVGADKRARLTHQEGVGLAEGDDRLAASRACGRGGFVGSGWRGGCRGGGRLGGGGGGAVVDAPGGAAVAAAAVVGPAGTAGVVGAHASSRYPTSAAPAVVSRNCRRVHLPARGRRAAMCAPPSRIEFKTS